MKPNCCTQLKLKCANKKQKTQSAYIIVPLKQHIPSETNYTLSSLLKLCSFLRQPELFECRHRLVQYVQPFLSSFMWGSNSCWDLGIMDGFLIFLSEVGCITCFDYPTSFSSEEDVCGEARGEICRYWIERADYFNQAHTECSSVEQMLFNPHLYHSQSTDSCGSHHLFPTVTSVAALLFANYVSQHALIMPRSWTPPSEGDSSGGRKSLIRPSVHLLKGRGGGWVEEMR